MSGDLEDFLKRAAARRQAKTTQQQATQQQAPPKRVPPQYSDSRTERNPHSGPVDEVVEAEVVSASVVEDVVMAQPVTQQKSSNAAAGKPDRVARRAKAKAEAKAEREFASQAYDQAPATTGSQPSAGFSAENLIEMLKRPEGVQQAILLREILDRPEHRW